MTHKLTIPGGGGGSGVIPSHFRSVNVKHTINIQKFDITNLSYRGRYVKLHLCFQLLPAHKKPLLFTHEVL